VFVPALEPVAGVRVVASPAALDAAHWTGEDVDVLRIAPDEALGLGATGVEIDDADAIVESEAGFAVALLDDVDVAGLAGHMDWALPSGPGTVAQGKIAGVPAKALVGDPTLLVTNAAYADELRRRLGWD
jgi:hypothetical protein